MSASPNTGKTGGQKRPRTAGTRVTWPDVLAVVQGDETRSRCLLRYRLAGFTPDDFGRSRLAREAMSDALTRTEDLLEYQAVDRPRRAHLYDAERAAIRNVRRRLEREVWP